VDVPRTYTLLFSSVEVPVLTTVLLLLSWGSCPVLSLRTSRSSRDPLIGGCHQWTTHLASRCFYPWRSLTPLLGHRMSRSKLFFRVTSGVSQGILQRIGSLANHGFHTWKLAWYVNTAPDVPSPIQGNCRSEHKLQCIFFLKDIASRVPW